MIYNSLILSHLNYNIKIWGFGNYLRLLTLQKQALRHISKSHYNAHTSPIAKNLNTLLIDDIFRISCFKFYYKYKNGSLPLYFYSHEFLKTNNPLRHTSRQIKLPSYLNNYVSIVPIIQSTKPIPTSNKISSTKCLRFFIPKLISCNYIPNNALQKINTHSLNGFINFSKKYIINNYSSTCHILHCYICSKN